ncbi:nodulation protein NodH [Palleronia sediminis]|uniref:Nodulation protein NodH n=1 Tax=Palleronia sediminis TaxID=2547833 RepID=A0A4V3B977_9RHOB|nr:nodulation protein NodH [Palleronia sediminis]TDL78189.1 nodulation protein NodH [Palleronia sediminis]
MPFTSFVVLAEMRTGSNFLEENLNAIPGLRCWGEAFNPHFMGGAGKTEMLGMDLAAREADPGALLDRIRDRTDGLAGFRLFTGHDPRIFVRVMGDRDCAKIVLTRNPLDSFVSLQIARQTNQWRLSDLKNARSTRIHFDIDAFHAHLARLQATQLDIMRRLQTTGQTAFYIAYEDVGELDVMNGLAAWLGVPGRIEALSRKTKVQNPDGLRDKVENYDEAVAALSGIDHFALNRTPSFEPRRGPNVPSYVGAARAPLLFVPVKGGPMRAVEAWLAALDGVGTGDLLRDMRQKELRQWLAERPGHRRFSVLRHPVARAHDAFCRHILLDGPERFTEIADTLRTTYAVPLPQNPFAAEYDAEAHRAAFMGFLKFVKGNLGGQTSIRVDPAWATQTAILQGLADFAIPDLLIREDDLPRMLSMLAGDAGIAAPVYAPEPEPGPHPLAAIRDPRIDRLVAQIYARDYLMFGWV